MTNKDILTLAGTNKLKQNSGKKMDIILMNPPYDNGLHERFLLKTIDIANKIISIQPLAWLLSNRQSKRVTNIIDKVYCNIDIPTKEEVKLMDIRFGSNIGIHYIDNIKPHKIILNKKEYDKCSDIKIYSGNDVLEEFASKILPVEDSLQNHVCKIEKTNKYYLEVAKIRGHKYELDISDDFYTIISNNIKWLKENKIGKIEDLPENIMFFAFDTLEQIDNFIIYLQTYFVRACLMLTKFDYNLNKVRYSTIPMLNFNNKYNDDILFDKFDVNNLKDKIKHILPNYYNL